MAGIGRGGWAFSAHDGTIFIMAIVASVRAYLQSPDTPAVGDRPVLATYVALAIGLTLTLIHLISIPITNTSVNPARSTGPALLVGGWAIQQLWLFWVAPLLGAVAAGGFWRWLK